MKALPVNIFWFKRDLRLQDNEALVHSLSNGLTLPIYIFEPSLIKDIHYDNRHFQFVKQSIEDINKQIAHLGAKVAIFYAEAKVVFEYLIQELNINSVYSYEETGLKLTFDRDKAIQKILSKNNIKWFETPTNGIIRGLKNRRQWMAYWNKVMHSYQVGLSLTAEKNPFVYSKQIDDLACDFIGYPYIKNEPQFQVGGELKAQEILSDFLNNRHTNYSNHISKPTQSRTNCSRLSPYIAWGNISIRQVYQATQVKKQNEGNKRALANFGSRLRWHCHFIQKFESECEIEFTAINPAYNAMEYTSNEEHYEAWKKGKTGYPLVDACMRCLNETGYLNFRMRAMVLSFCTHNLLIHWQKASYHLAPMFLDFEPGIHYPQIQMQAGITGTNTLRIYNPVKQSQDHDPEGIFIKKWVPELREVPSQYIHEPHLIPPLEQLFIGVNIGEDYPLPIVNATENMRISKDRIWKIRKSREGLTGAKQVLKKHIIPNIHRNS